MLVAAAVITVVVLAAAGYHPFWSPGPPPTLVEALYEADRATVYALLQSGADPNAPGVLRNGDENVTIQPIEAAILSGDLGTVRLVYEGGGSFDDVPRLVCLAQAINADAIADFLRARASVLDTGCAGVQLPPH